MAGAADRSARRPAAGLPAAGRDAWIGRALAWRPPRLAIALAALALAVHVVIWGPAAPFGRSVAGGIAMEALGIAWMLWAWWLFRRAGTPLRPTERPRRFVDEGPYRVGRHPMYLGMTVAMLGLALKLGAPTVALAAVAFAAIVQQVHIPHEESQLRAAFGGWYSDYMASVRRWL